NKLIPGNGPASTAVLLLQAGVGDLPPLVVAADEMVAGNAHVIHEDGVLVVAHEQLHLPYLQPLRRHRDHEVTHVPVPGRVIVRDHRPKEVVGAFRVPLGTWLSADEDVLTGEQPVVTIPNGAAGVAGQVCAGPGLGCTSAT
ncbi:hypothetical protein GBAR_LOCUS28370, partial [Geodia barretti]